MAAPSWRCLSAEDGDLHGSFGQQNGGTVHEERGLSFLLKQEDREIQDSYLHLFNKLDVAVKEMKQYVIQINKWVETPVCPAESSSDRTPALTSENTPCLSAPSAYSLLLVSNLLVQIHLCIYYCPSLLKVYLNSTATVSAHYIFQYKNLFGTNISFGIPYKQSLYEIFEIFVYRKAD